MDELVKRKVLRYRWIIFGVMASTYVFVYFHRQCPAVVALDMQEAFQASAGLVGLLASAYFYPYAALQLPAGLLSDSMGPRRTATSFLLFAVVGSVLLGLAPTMEIAVAARIMVGVGVSMVFIPTMKLLSQWFRPGEFAFMMGILSVMGGVGLYLATKPLALFAGWVGWRAAFEAIGVATLFMGALVWLLVRNRPQDLGWPSLAEIDHTGPGVVAQPMKISVWAGARWVVTESRFWPLAGWFFLTAGVFFSFAGLWAGPYLQHVYGLTRSQAGDVLSMIALGLILGSPLMSFLSDRVFKSRKKVIVISTLVLTMELAVMNLFPSGFSRAALYLIVFIFCVSGTSVVVVAFTTAKELFPIEIAGTAIGTVNLFPFLGAAIFQVALGKVLDAYPKTLSGAYPLEAYSAVLMAMLAASVLALACSLMLKETFPSTSRAG